MQPAADPKSRARWERWSVVVAIVGIVAVFAWWRLHGGAPPGERAVVAEAAQPVAVTTAVVRLADTPQTLEVTGTVGAQLETAVASRVSSRVLRVYVREGDFVRRGQPLVAMDARDLDAAVSQAGANVRAATVGRDSAVVAAEMEDSVSQARVNEARGKVAEAEAAVQAADARLEAVQTGPRRQERAQASLAVVQAKSNLELAASNLRRMDALVGEGAISKQQYDIVRSQHEVAKAQFDAAVQAQSMTDEGSRQEDVRAAKEAGRQARAALEQAHAGLRQAEAARAQVRVRRQDVKTAAAQIDQMRAAERIARVTQEYSSVNAPFDGVVTARLADPGAMASPGTPLLRVQGGALRMEAVVPESALRFARMGARVPVRLDALRRTVDARVAEVRPQGDAATHSFIVKLELPPACGALAGMFGRAALVTGDEPRLLAPMEAVVEREGLQYVYVVDSSRHARLRLVTTGERRGGQVQVLSGVAAGEWVATGDLTGLTDGAAVNNSPIPGRPGGAEGAGHAR